ncbi:unnamed protein product [Nezara viridula]|uniref:Uncharacterized protein n=1 Tax=Nezara viridula TaxID=85310 RepID=A0A9P0EG14_NEZVI|nr:unnamed protein product [Nezara viridula]
MAIAEGNSDSAFFRNPKLPLGNEGVAIHKPLMCSLTLWHIWKRSCRQSTHKVRSIQQWLQKNIPEFISESYWLSGSPDLNPLDYRLWSEQERMACHKAYPNLESIKQSLVRVVESFPQEVLHAAIDDWISVIFRVKSAKAVKITDLDLLKRLGMIVTTFTVLLLIRTIVAPPLVIVGRTADDLKAYLCKTDWWDHSFTTILLRDAVLLLPFICPAFSSPRRFLDSKSSQNHGPKDIPIPIHHLNLSAVRLF